MQSFKVLVVDDFEPFRRFACSTLKQRSQCQVLEASGGLEAIQKTEEAKPDLILFDIGLPKLSGIEAARRLLQLGYTARILFISQESSPEVIQEALGFGALGYVHKLRAQSDLLPAIDAALEGKRFVSSGLLTDEPSHSVDANRAKELEMPTSKRRRSRVGQTAGPPKVPLAISSYECFPIGSSLSGWKDQHRREGNRRTARRPSTTPWGGTTRFEGCVAFITNPECRNKSKVGGGWREERYRLKTNVRQNLLHYTSPDSTSSEAVFPLNTTGLYERPAKFRQLRKTAEVSFPKESHHDAAT
jgi:DNA-binding NarL/FixJ family response regulator